MLKLDVSPSDDRLSSHSDINNLPQTAVSVGDILDLGAIYQERKDEILKYYFQNKGQILYLEGTNFVDENLDTFLLDLFEYGLLNITESCALESRDIESPDQLFRLIRGVYIKRFLSVKTPRDIFVLYYKLRRQCCYGNFLNQLNYYLIEYLRTMNSGTLKSFLAEIAPSDREITPSQIITYIHFLDRLSDRCMGNTDEKNLLIENIILELRNEFLSRYHYYGLSQFLQVNLSDNCGYSDYSVKHFRGRILNKGINGKGIPVYNPIFKIATDRAIQLEGGTRVTNYSYTLDNEKLGNKESYAHLYYDNIFNSEYGEDYKYLLQILHRPEFLYQIETALGIEFSDYPFLIQPPFLQFLAYATLEDFARVREFLAKASDKKDKYYRFRLFLATTEKPNRNKPNEIPIAEIILELEGKLIETYSRENKENGEQAGKERAQLIFKKYSDVMDIIEKEAQEIQDSLIAHDAIVTFSKQEFSRNLLGRANNTILRDFYKEVEHGSPESIEELFGKCRADLLQFGSLFRSITVHTPGDTLDTILSSYKVKREIVNGVDLVTKNKENIIKGLYQRNYRDRPDFDEVMRLVHDDFEKDKKDINTEYSFFYYTTGEDTAGKDHGKPILTVKFTKQPDGTIYAGGLNSEPMLLQSSFGIYAFRGLLQEYNDKVVTGKVAKDSKKLLREYGKLGFESDEILHTDESGLECYDIIRPVQKK